MDRFNLTPTDLALMDPRADQPKTATYTWTTAWSNYVRKTFLPKRFHSMPGVGKEVVAEG